MVRRNPAPPRRPVEVEVDGTRFSGWYTVQSGVITVRTVLHGSEATHVGGSTPEVLARMLLHELVSKSKAK